MGTHDYHYVSAFYSVFNLPSSTRFSSLRTFAILVLILNERPEELGRSDRHQDGEIITKLFCFCWPTVYTNLFVKLTYEFRFKCSFL